MRPNLQTNATPPTAEEVMGMTGAAGASATVGETPVTPVRSAKEAINAMYAQDPSKRLSNYLATSAKEIINANSRATNNNRSAANLHRGSIGHRVESARPSASGLMKSAQKETVITPSDTSAAMDPLARKTAPVVKPQSVKIAPAARPVVRTSLKLGPKKTPRATATRTAGAETVAGSAAATAGQTTMNRAAAAARAARVAGARPVARVQRPRMRAPRGLMQDIVRPRKAQPTPPEPAAPSMAETIATAAQAAVAQRQATRPRDSIKRRFRAAPKDYAAQATTQEAGYVGYQQAATQTAERPTVKPAVEIYGMMDEEPTGKASELGVVKDYVPASGLKEQKVATGSGNIEAAPDNNKYAIKGQSPFFLKSVNVEKRPLSDAPTQGRGDIRGTLYERPQSTPIDKKNAYDKPAKPAKAALPTKPTVIIPASRRSKAPLIFLLILTVILGAAVGAFVYLCFFQYLD